MPGRRHARAPADVPTSGPHADITAALAGSPRRRVFTPFSRHLIATDLLAFGIAALIVGVTVGGITPWVLPVLATVWVLWLYRLGGYDSRALVEAPLRGWTLYSAIGRVALVCALLPLLFPDFPAASYIAFLALLLLTTTAGRDVFAGWVRRRQAEGRYHVPVVLRGPGADLRALVDALHRDGQQPFTVVALQVTSGELTSDRTVSAQEDPVCVAAQFGAEAVVMVGGQPEAPEELRRIVWRLESAGTQVAWVPLASSLAVPKVREIGHTGVPVLTFEERSLAPETSRRKLVLDWTLALITTILLSPVLLLIAVAIRSESRGPVLFRQTRIGRAGVPFTMYKFRTMREGAEQELDDLAHLNVHEGGTLFKIPDDPRVTRVGRVLRKFSLDEVPQLFNVLRGEMSLVGPRPPLPGEVANYPDDLHRRFLVRPGLTGLWQVSGRSDLDPVESARLDAYYVEHWSPLMDLRIVLKTTKVVLFGDGAY